MVGFRKETLGKKKNLQKKKVDKRHTRSQLSWVKVLCFTIHHPNQSLSTDLRLSYYSLRRKFTRNVGQWQPNGVDKHAKKAGKHTPETGKQNATRGART